MILFIFLSCFFVLRFKARAIVSDVISGLYAIHFLVVKNPLYLFYMWESEKISNMHIIEGTFR